MSPFSASSSNSTLPPSRDWTPQEPPWSTPQIEKEANPTATQGDVHEDVVSQEELFPSTASESEAPVSHSDDAGSQTPVSQIDDAGSQSPASHSDDAGSQRPASHSDNAGSQSPASHSDDAGSQSPVSHSDNAGSQSPTSHSEDAASHTHVSDSDDTGSQSQEPVGHPDGDQNDMEAEAQSPVVVDATFTEDCDGGDTQETSGLSCVAESPVHSTESVGPSSDMVEPVVEDHPPEASASQLFSTQSTTHTEDDLSSDHGTKLNKSNSTAHKADIYEAGENAGVLLIDQGETSSETSSQPSDVPPQDNIRRRLRSRTNSQSSRKSLEIKTTQTTAAPRQNQKDEKKKKSVNKENVGKPVGSLKQKSSIPVAVEDKASESIPESDQPGQPSDAEEEEGPPLLSPPVDLGSYGSRQATENPPDLNQPEATSSGDSSNTKEPTSKDSHKKGGPALDPLGDGVTGSICRVENSEPIPRAPCSALQNFRTRKR